MMQERSNPTLSIAIKSIARPKVIRGGCLLDACQHRGEAADILVVDDLICEIGPPGMEVPADSEVIPASDKLLIPGLINAHTHSHYTLVKGCSASWSLEMHLNAGSWMSAERTREDLYLGALLGATEMLRHGCTACYDMVAELPLPSPAGMAAVTRAYEDSGMRAVISPMLADRTFWQAIPGLIEALPENMRSAVDQVRTSPYEVSLEACRGLLENWPQATDQIKFGIAPTIPLFCSDDFLVGCRNLADEFDVGMHTHLAESKVQAVSGLKRYNTSLTAHLDKLGFLGPQLTAAHGVWLDNDDLLRLSDHGVSVAHNPGSNMRLGNGLAAVAPMLDAGINVGIGTDTSTCSDHLNMFEATRLASLVSRAQTPDYDRWLSSGNVLSMATLGGARALGLESCGQLTPGYKADIVFIDLNHIHYLPLNDVLNQLVFCENGEAVDAVMVGGRMVVEKGVVTTVDYEQLKNKVRAAVDRLRETTAERRRELDALEPIVGAFCLGLAKTPHHVHRYIDSP
jgi:5-methylthioadenosine/S-adenosylhomocysteine deaminase